MIDFFSDLDNTLIYSHRFPPRGERIAVEFLNGSTQSYMSKTTLDFLSVLGRIHLIPTTTRTREQYLRLSETLTSFGCRYALVCNGGMLLNCGEIDTEWLNETKEIAKGSLSNLQDAEKIMRCDFPEQNIHSVSGIMVYAKTANPVSDAVRLSTILDGAMLNVYHDRHKVYCIPASLNKGTALRRFTAREGIDFSVAAGDDIPDIPMLEAADVAILPEKLNSLVAGKRKYVFNGTECFSDYICETLLRLL